MTTIAISCVGSRGDVQPYVALAEALRAPNTDVVVATHGQFRALVEGRGLGFAELPGNPQEVVLGGEAQRLMGSGPGLVRFVRGFLDLLEPWFGALVEAVTPVCEAADVLVYSPLAFVAWHLGEAMQKPTALAALQPFAPTRAFPAVTLGQRRLGSTGNLVTHHVAEQLAWHAVRRAVETWRTEELGLEPLGFLGPGRVLRAKPEPYLFGYSRHIVPKPPDWGTEHRVTGYWFLDDAEESLAPELEAFLEDGDPPIYVGFGSMVTDDPEQTTAAVVEATRRARLRAVVSTGWGGLTPGSTDDRVLFVGDVPHRSLFPRVRAVVHHGGAGTTGAAFRAGVPQVVVPFFADQPFWAGRVYATGAGPPPIPRRRLDVVPLTEALNDLTTNESYPRNARALGTRVRSEDGVSQARDFLDTLL